MAAAARFKKKQEKAHAAEMSKLIAESPAHCALEVYTAREAAKVARRQAVSREDKMLAEADLVHYLKRLKASTGLDEKPSHVETPELLALRSFFEAAPRPRG